LGWSAAIAAEQLGIAAFSGFHTNYHTYSRHYRLGWLHGVIFRYLRAFHNRTLGTLVSNLDLRDRLNALGFRNVSFLGRGVDSQLFGPHRRCAVLRRQWGLSDLDLAVLYVGRIAPEKNLALAVDSYRAMQKVNRSLKFVIVGDGPLRPSLEKQNADFIFSGMKTGEELAKHYASADLFLFPSETETFGNVTLEAMASGLVVVAYDYAAANLHITHGKTGVLVPYRESTAFIESAAKIVSRPESMDAVRRRAREYVAALDWRDVAGTFEGLLSVGGDRNRTTSNSLTDRRGWRFSQGEGWIDAAR
jgi:glycosyltransferase involved in cell wall biosynthesis